MKVSLIGLAQNAANELQFIYNKNESHRSGRSDCDCRVCCDVDHTKLYASLLRELAANARELKADPSKLDEFLSLYALQPSHSSEPVTRKI